MKTFTLSVTLILLVFTSMAAGEQTLQTHKTGIWSIEGTEDMDRWIVIHNLNEASESGMYHIEVIGRKNGEPEWSIVRIQSHMAITEGALKKSVIAPLKKGAVYPEVYNDAFREWTLQNKKGTADICLKTVTECLQSH